MQIFGKSKSTYTPKIRIINLVDILLVLLLFLFITTTFRAEAPAVVKVALPEARTAEAADEASPDHLLITIAPDETVYLDETAVSPKELEAALINARAASPDLVLQFSADRSVSYGRIVSVVDAARAAGIKDITAFTKKSVK